MKPVVFISGSRRGLGFAVAKEYAAHGFNIVLNDRLDEELLYKRKEFLEKEFSCQVLVNSVAPGWINTEMNADLPEDLVKDETSKIYLERFAEPEEVAKLVYFLGSNENTYINNEIIKIDGGY